MTNLWIDTNVLLRFITGDPPDMAGKAFLLFQRAERGEVILRLSAVVVAETVWTLTSYYRYSKQQVSDVLVALISAKGISCDDSVLLLEALLQMANHNIDFVDAYLATTARHHAEAVCSFDSDFRRLNVAIILPE